MWLHAVCKHIRESKMELKCVKQIDEISLSSRTGKSLLGFQPAVSMQVLNVYNNASDGPLKYSITT